MKKVKFIVFSSAVALLYSCGPLMQGVTYKVTPDPLEMHADSVKIHIEGTFPEKGLNKKAYAEITPYLVYEGGEQAFKTVKLQGEKVQDNNQSIKFTGGSFKYDAVIPYNDAMLISKLEVRAKATKKSKTLEIPPVEIAKGVIATPRLVKLETRTILGKDKFVRITPEITEADIHFLINQADIRSTELTQADIKFLKDYIKQNSINPRKQFKGVSVSAYASPDGPEDNNAKLADKRGNVGQKYLGDEFKKNKIDKSKDANFFNTKATPEDWEGFQKEVQKSDLEDKDIILRVLSMYSDPVQREKEIKNIAAAYTKLKDNVLPKLRRSILALNVDVVGWSDDELINLAQNKPDTLKLEEILYAATLFKGLDQQAQIYKQAIRLFPLDWRGPNNLGYVYAQQGKYNEALTAFQDAKKLDGGNKIILNNIGAATLALGNFDEALKILNEASGAGPEVNYNLGIIYIKKGDYAKAVSNFGSDCSFNAGLAKVLNKDNSGASKALDCITNQEDGLIYYLKAIIGTRTNNADLLYNSLRAAVSKDPTLGNKAKKDMEFVKYFEDATFKSIVGQ